MENTTGPKEKALKTQVVSTEIIKKSRLSGPTKIGDAELDCYILEDGTALINS